MPNASHNGFQPRTVLITGGAGFIGSNLVRWLLHADDSVTVINLDALTYAGNLESLEDVSRTHGGDGDGRYLFVLRDSGEAERWQVKHDAWSEYACREAGRELTRAEWSEFVPGQDYRRVCGS